MMRSDRVLFENPVQLGLWNSQDSAFFSSLRAFVEISAEAEKEKGRQRR